MFVEKGPGLWPRSAESLSSSQPLLGAPETLTPHPATRRLLAAPRTLWSFLSYLWVGLAFLALVFPEPIGIHQDVSCHLCCNPVPSPAELQLPKPSGVVHVIETITHLRTCFFSKYWNLLLL